MLGIGIGCVCGVMVMFILVFIVFFFKLKCCLLKIVFFWVKMVELMNGGFYMRILFVNGFVDFLDFISYFRNGFICWLLMISRWLSMIDGKLNGFLLWCIIGFCFWKCKYCLVEYCNWNEKVVIYSVMLCFVVK